MAFWDSEAFTIDYVVCFPFYLEIQVEQQYTVCLSKPRLVSFLLTKSSQAWSGQAR